MRQCSTSAPVESCTAVSPSTPNTRFAAVHLLTNQSLYFCVEPKTRTRELYKQTCQHLAGKGMIDTKLFGLAILSDGEYLFADPDYKLSKYAPKSWRSSSTHGLDNNGKPLLVLHFRVQFYVESPLLLSDEVSRHHYYRQLRQNVAERGLVHAGSSEEALYLLAGLALQADQGDYTPAPTPTTAPPTTYFQPNDYFPQQMVKSGNESRLVQMAIGAHRANRGLSRADAEVHYIREASSADTSPLPHASHLYRLRYKKQEANCVLLSICTQGIQLYEENSSKSLNGTFLWNDIEKLYFDRKKFEIRANWQPSGQKLTYYTSCDEKSKHLLALCRETHQFSMSIQARLAEVRRKEAEDDLDLEVMINSPPAVASVESLPHACDAQRTSERSATCDHFSHLSHSLTHTLSHPHSCPQTDLPSQDVSHTNSGGGGGGGGGGGASGSALTVNSMKTRSSLIGGATTPATTDGSQCSSSCSTVVVASCAPEPREERNGMTERRGSTTSSLELELGFSHTAQNSVISDSTSTCLELDYSVQSAHTSSGVYTLRSSTHATNTDTVACSSETSGIGVDESDGHRTRSGSLVSASGSFHGDGSDPSDAGRGTLLTAEELSDLIVGRSPKPRRGVYPSRATVSSTLDSDSDYVTLPPPPLPPPRSDSEALSRSYSTLDSEPPQSHLSPLYHEDSLINSRKVMEEQMLQQQIQFQHLASPYSPQLVLPKAQSFLDHILVNSAPASIPLHLPPDTRHHALLPSAYSHLPEHRKYPVDPASRMKAAANTTQNLIPIVTSNNYLDVRGSGAAFLQHYHQKFPPPPHPRQPPPPPPPPPPRPTLATVYTSQVTSGQIEQFKQQLYSDVDYVIYPMQDPAISKQEYMDSKLALGHYQHPPPPPYPHKSRLLYRSTPNVAAYLPLPTPTTTPIHHYASNQNLTTADSLSFVSTHHPSSPYSAAASYSSSSTHSLRYDPLTLQMMPSVLSSGFTRTQSDDNILNCVYDKPKFRRPPPPPPYELQNQYVCEAEELRKTLLPPTPVRHTSSLSSAAAAVHSKPVFPPSLSKTVLEEQRKLNNGNVAKGIGAGAAAGADGLLDISTLREKSKNLDLPLISALCNDKSLLKQTNAFVMPKHPSASTASTSTPRDDRPKSWHVKSPKKCSSEAAAIVSTESVGTSTDPSPKKNTLFASFLSAKSSPSSVPAVPLKYATTSNSKLKYPVSGLSTNQIVKSSRKTATSCHTHPSDSKHHAHTKLS
ncbi:protein expanded [Nilaparvata lugens]|uniref:protein expanded n=1 Tax=Nilaparvata lugens TaxID=108931 RepID=UPI00193CE9DF|nr:protein expanded [Nilaparvata lugens]